MRRCEHCQIDYPDLIVVCPDDGQALPPPEGGAPAERDTLLGTTIDGRYQVEKVLGEGGMGLVYACRHAIIDKRVALKVLRKDAVVDSSLAQRFLAEAKAASKIGQQNIVDITDFGTLTDGLPYFVMEFLDGPTLSNVMAAGPLPPSRAIAIALQVARGLGAAHAKGIVHRDLKPDNLFVLQREGIADFVKIVDFGIARDATVKKRLTVAGTVMGTPEYMAPEQASGQDTDHRADQYALGCILYETLTGRVPFRGENPMQTLTMHVYEPLPPMTKVRADLEIPVELEALVMRALMKDRESRFADLDEMTKAMQAVQPVLAKIPHRVRTQRARAVGSESHSDLVAPKRMPAWFIPLVGACVLAIGGMLFLTRRPVRVEVRQAPVVVQPAVAVARPVTPAVTTPISSTFERVEITLRSVPLGAQVFLGDELLGLTPMKTVQPQGRATPLHFVLRKAGFRDASRDVVPLKDSDVELLLFHEVQGPKHVPPVVALKSATPATPKPPQPTQAQSKTVGNAELRNPF